MSSNQIEKSEELDLEFFRRDGTLRKPVTIWAVRVGDELSVRSAYGHTSAWFRSIKLRHEGRMRAGGVENDVAFVEEASPDINDPVDAA